MNIWTEERVAAFKNHCRQKTFSYGDIAKKMSADFGVTFTRNSCVGKAHRLGIVCDLPKSIRYRPAKVRSERKPRLLKTGNGHFKKCKIEAVEWKLRAVEIACETTFNDLTGCRYPSGDGLYLFCNGKQQEGSSYCTAHHALCWEKPKPRLERLARVA